MSLISRVNAFTLPKSWDFLAGQLSCSPCGLPAVCPMSRRINVISPNFFPISPIPQGSPFFRAFVDSAPRVDASMRRMFAFLLLPIMDAFDGFCKCEPLWEMRRWPMNFHAISCGPKTKVTGVCFRGFTLFFEGEQKRNAFLTVAEHPPAHSACSATPTRLPRWSDLVKRLVT